MHMQANPNPDLSPNLNLSPNPNPESEPEPEPEPSSSPNPNPCPIPESEPERLQGGQPRRGGGCARLVRRRVRVRVRMRVRDRIRVRVRVTRVRVRVRMSARLVRRRVHMAQPRHSRNAGPPRMRSGSPASAPLAPRWSTTPSGGCAPPPATRARHARHPPRRPTRRLPESASGEHPVTRCRYAATGPHAIGRTLNISQSFRIHG